MILQAILEQMGLELPPELRTDEEPGPEPAPAPAVDEEEDDSFFDDDFFDDDAGFDETVARMDAEFDETVSAWDREYEETVARWDEAREEYLEKVEEYRSATIPLRGAEDDLQAGGGYGSLQDMRPGEFHLIPNAMDLAVKNQAYRGTCTAFSGVRALETVMLQNGIQTDFSEQHFYYLSKPKCKQKPCGKSEEGSSVDGGLRATRDTRVEALLPEGSCPYEPRPDANNITYTPLARCRTDDGVVRAGEIRSLNSHDQLLSELSNNRPVIVGFAVSRSYDQSRGLVLHYDKVNETSASGRDAGRHANLLVGYVKLPPSMSREGRFCVITANSWELGWGRGGHACLTETWLRQNLSSAVSLGSVVLTDAGLQYYGLD